MKNIIVTTQHRGVWFCEVEESTDLTARTLQNLRNARMAIYWGTERGIQQLCETGPTRNSKISAASDIIVLHDVTAVFNVTDEAAAVWKSK
jgi:hypothetical protein